MKRRLMEWAGPGILFVTVLSVIAFAGLYVRDKHLWAEAKLAEIEPRYARLTGLAAERGSLDAALAAANSTMARHVYPASREVSQAGNDAQQRARDVFARAGLEVLSSQVLPAKTVKQFDRIPISLRMEGELPALQAALAALPSLSPTLYVEGFNIQGIGVPKADVTMRLVVQMEFFVLRART